MAKRVLVIGGGVVGLSTAYYCSRRGYDVTVLERNAVENEGCSYGNAGLIIPSHVVPLASPGMVKLGLKYMFDPAGPFYIKPRFNLQLLAWTWQFWRSATPEHVRRAAPLIRDLNLASRDCYDELSVAAGDDFDLRKRGVINLCRTEHGLEHEAKTAELAREMGLVAEVVDANRAGELYGDLKMNIVGGVFYPQDYFLSPNRFMPCLRRLVEENGVKIEWNTEVTDWRTEGSRIACALTSHGERDADEYVISSGSWSPKVAGGLKIHIPIEAGKGYSLTMQNPPRLPRIAAILSEARVAITPMGSALRVGGTMEIAGLDESITQRRVDRIIDAACLHFPDFSRDHFKGIAPWRGLRPVTPDGMPYVGRVQRYANLSIAAGHAMMGFSLGPITGKLIAETISGEAPSIHMDMLSPDRFS